MNKYESFNQSGFSKFLNKPAGRILRLAAGIGFLAYGITHRKRASGLATIAWGLLPFSAGALDVCYISALLGGPLSGKKIRK
jgi:hypothetical protein